MINIAKDNNLIVHVIHVLALSLLDKLMYIEELLGKGVDK